MRKGSVTSHRLSVLCLLVAATLPVPVTAQDYPPNGPKIPPVTLTGGRAPAPMPEPAPGPRDEQS